LFKKNKGGGNVANFRNPVRPTCGALPVATRYGKTGVQERSPVAGRIKHPNLNIDVLPIRPEKRACRIQGELKLVRVRPRFPIMSFNDETAPLHSPLSTLGR